MSIRLLTLLLLFIASVSAIPSIPFDLTLAVQMTKYAANCYCSIEDITSWSCYTCQNTGLSGFIVDTIAHDVDLGTLAYVGYNVNTKSIVVSFRGSSNTPNWIEDFYYVKTDLDLPYCDGCKTHSGFFAAFNSTRKDTFASVKKLLGLYPSYTVHITGHSLGAAMATLCAAELQYYESVTAIVHNMGSPRVGNKEFSEYFAKYIPNTYRIVHNNDIVPHVPFEIMYFTHVCTEFWQTTSVKQCDQTCEDPTCADSVPPYDFSAAAHSYYLNVTMGC